MVCASAANTLRADFVTRSSLLLLLLQVIRL
jgi:hypothetical protein